MSDKDTKSKSKESSTLSSVKDAAIGAVIFDIVGAPARRREENHIRKQTRDMSIIQNQCDNKMSIVTGDAATTQNAADASKMITAATLIQNKEKQSWLSQLKNKIK